MEPQQEEEESVLTPEIATLVLNFCIVFVVAFFVPSTMPGNVQQAVGLPGIGLASAAFAAAVTFATRPKKE